MNTKQIKKETVLITKNKLDFEIYFENKTKFENKHLIIVVDKNNNNIYESEINLDGRMGIEQLATIFESLAQSIRKYKEKLSNCCNEPIENTDICTKCKEHCEGVENE